MLMYMWFKLFAYVYDIKQCSLIDHTWWTHTGWGKGVQMHDRWDTHLKVWPTCAPKCACIHDQLLYYVRWFWSTQTNTNTKTYEYTQYVHVSAHVIESLYMRHCQCQCMAWLSQMPARQYIGVKCVCLWSHLYLCIVVPISPGNDM